MAKAKQKAKTVKSARRWPDAADAAESLSRLPRDFMLAGGAAAASRRFDPDAVGAGLGEEGIESIEQGRRRKGEGGESRRRGLCPSWGAGQRGGGN